MYSRYIPDLHNDNVKKLLYAVIVRRTIRCFDESTIWESHNWHWKWLRDSRWGGGKEGRRRGEWYCRISVSWWSSRSQWKMMREEDYWMDIRGEEKGGRTSSNIELTDDSSTIISSSTCAITTSRIVSWSNIFENENDVLQTWWIIYWSRGERKWKHSWRNTIQLDGREKYKRRSMRRRGEGKRGYTNWLIVRQLTVWSQWLHERPIRCGSRRWGEGGGWNMKRLLTSFYIVSHRDSM